MLHRSNKGFSVVLTTVAFAGVFMAMSEPTRDLHATPSAGSYVADVVPTALQPCNGMELAYGTNQLFVWSMVPNAIGYVFKHSRNGETPYEVPFDDHWFQEVVDEPGVYIWSVRSLGPDWVSSWSAQCHYFVMPVA